MVQALRQGWSGEAAGVNGSKSHRHEQRIRLAEASWGPKCSRDCVSEVVSLQWLQKQWSNQQPNSRVIGLRRNACRFHILLCICWHNGNMGWAMGTIFKDNKHPYVMWDEPSRACASGGTWVGVQSHTCEYAINSKTCGTVQALAAVIRGLHAVMPPKACRPGCQRRGRAKERGREDWRTGGGGQSAALERSRCLTGLELVKTEEIRASSFIIRGECRKQDPCWGKSQFLHSKDNKLWLKYCWLNHSFSLVFCINISKL